MGFGVVNSHRLNGIHSGTGILLTLNDHDKDNKEYCQKSLQSTILSRKVLHLIKATLVQ